MQTIFRMLNLILGPILTLVFKARFAQATGAGKDASDAFGGAAAGLIMLAVEMILTQGPKHSTWLRRWLDPRAAFEGVWLQEVIGNVDNALGIFLMNYELESDSYTLVGHAYSADGTQWARWNSTHMFIDGKQLRATYLWEGDVVAMVPLAESDKSGRTVLELRKPPAFSLPMAGDGQVLHLGEKARVKFRLHRVTGPLIAELGLPFTLRELRIDAHEEESRLAAASLRARRDVPAH